MIPIDDAVAQFLAVPAPILILDTCNLLDLFRRDPTRQKPRVPPEEIQAASRILRGVTDLPPALHLVVPELVPGEFAEHADRIQEEFEKWLEFHDENQTWLMRAAAWIGTALPAPVEVHPLGCFIFAGRARLRPSRP